VNERMKRLVRCSQRAQAIHPLRIVPAYVREFAPYIPSKPDPELKKLYGCKTLFRLNNNENALGPPPGSRELIRSFPPLLGAVYPSGDSYYLRHDLAAFHQVDLDQILVGNGANEVISSAIKAFCEQGDNIITADKTFAVYEWVATFSGSRGIENLYGGTAHPHGRGVLCRLFMCNRYGQRPGPDRRRFHLVKNHTLSPRWGQIEAPGETVVSFGAFLLSRQNVTRSTQGSRRWRNGEPSKVQCGGQFSLVRP
jgi:hypothetical protein